MYLKCPAGETSKPTTSTIPRPRHVGELWDTGFSFHRLEKDLYQTGVTHDGDFCQIQYNFLDENNHIFWECQISRQDMALSDYIENALKLNSKTELDYKEW